MPEKKNIYIIIKNTSETTHSVIRPIRVSHTEQQRQLKMKSMAGTKGILNPGG